MGAVGVATGAGATGETFVAAAVFVEPGLVAGGVVPVFVAGALLAGTAGAVPPAGAVEGSVPPSFSMTRPASVGLTSLRSGRGQKRKARKPSTTTPAALDATYSVADDVAAVGAASSS